MSDSRAFWLVLTNIALGIVAVLLILAVVTGTLCDLISKVKKRHAAWVKLDQDMHRMFGEVPLAKGQHRRH
jgi:hypothetical protein